MRILQKELVWLNGELMPAGVAGISLDDIGLLRGYGAFEVIRTFRGKPFLLDKHLDRLQKSAEHLNIDLPYDTRQITSAINELLAKNNYAESTIRIVLTGGALAGGLEYNPSKPNFFIRVTEFTLPDPKILTEGIKLVTTEYQRVLPEVKTLNYTIAVREWPRVKKAGAAELLYLWRGKILEASTSNFFLVKEKKLITPKEGVLLGATRNLVIELAKGEFALEERDIRTEELAECDEAFIAATNKDIMPVVKVDDQTIGHGTIGPITQRLIGLFYDYANSN